MVSDTRIEASGGLSAEPKAPRFDAMVLGASTGAIQALNVLLPALPADLPAAVVIAIHVPPRLPSLLVPLFSNKCALPVREATDKQPVTPGTIWFAPPDYHLMVEPTQTFALSIDEPVNYSRPSIDVLFESAALAYGKRLLGVILSGASRDGSLGARALRRCGGVLAVQEPSTAEASLLPQLTVEVAEPHIVGDLAELSAFIADNLRSL